MQLLIILLKLIRIFDIYLILSIVKLLQLLVLLYLLLGLPRLALPLKGNSMQSLPATQLKLNSTQLESTRSCSSLVLISCPKTATN